MFTPTRRQFIMALAASTTLSTPLLSTAQEAPKVLRIGTTAPGHIKFLLSRDQKFFDQALARQGTKVDYLVFTGGGSEVQTALGSGAIDVAYTGASPALRLAARSATATQFIGLSGVPLQGSVSIVVAKGSPLQSLPDLKGKKVAYLSGTIRHSVFVKALQSKGLSLKDVESMNMPFEASSAALARGDIDAIVETDITAAPLVNRGIARVLFDNTQHPEWEVPLLITANGEFAKKHPATLQTLLAADKQVAQWANQHFDQAVRIFARDRKSTEDAVRKEYPDGHFNEEPRITDQVLATLRSEASFMQEAKLLQGQVDFDRWVNKQFVETAYR